MEKITGKNNELIKDVKKLFTSSAKRRAQGLFALEGARLVFDVLNSSQRVKYFFVTPDARDKYSDLCREMENVSEKSYLISAEVSRKLTETDTPQGVFAVCEMQIKPLALSHGGKYIALDNVQDPGNLGTILRTAEALGIDGVIIGGGCDVYNPKALRASMGSVLRVNAATCDSLDDYIAAAKELGVPVYAACPDSSARRITDVDFSAGAMCIIGNEANGVSQSVLDLCDGRITIPMRGRAESLNANVAAAVTMWEMLR